MRASITQETVNGCGIACFAFVCNLSYAEAERFLGPKQAKSDNFVVKNLVSELRRFGLDYSAKYIKSGRRFSKVEGMIVLIRKSKSYPNAHYLVFHQGQWMDPWMNFHLRALKARSGYRKRLPGQPWYAIYPTLAH